MRRLIYVLGILFVAATALTSCLNGDDDDDAVVYDDAALTSFSLGTLNCYHHTTSSAGTDSVYKTTYTGSNYKMTIDQLGNKVYNNTLLPAGTDVAHVVCTIGARNSSYIFLQSLTSDSLRLYSSSDSIDFSQPRVIVVYPTDGSGSRSYTVTLAVAQSESTAVVWTEQAVADWPAADETWREAAVQQGLMPIGASSREQFALSADGTQLKVAVDGGQTWTDERLDAASAYLPDTQLALASWPLANAPHCDYTLLVGWNTKVNCTNMTTWRKVADYDLGSPSGQWVLVSDGSQAGLPVADGVSLTYYDGSVLAFYTDGTVYESIDQGLSWSTTTDYALPEGATGSVVVTTDADGRLWLQSNGRVWKAEK